MNELRSYQTRQPAQLIATLGSEPQVVTTVLDLLCKSGELIRKVSVVHTVTQDPLLSGAVEVLQNALNETEFKDRFSLEFFPIMDNNKVPLEDVQNPKSVMHAFRALYYVVWKAKKEGYKLHLSLAGGRKTMAVFAMVTAQLLFDDQDQLWHLHSSGSFLASKRLFPETDDEVHLISIPVFPWRQVSPALGELSDVEDPVTAIERYQSMRLDERFEKARIFIEDKLTMAERRAVSLLVTEGLPDNDIAARLSISPRTVEHQLRAAFRKAADCWNLPEVNRALLITLLNLYFTLLPGKDSNIGENTDDTGNDAG